MPRINVYGNRGKTMYQNNIFDGGMHYTSTELKEGYAQAIINLDISPTGTSARPRGAIKNIALGEHKLKDGYIYNPIQDPDYVYHIAFPVTINLDIYKIIKVGTIDVGLDDYTSTVTIRKRKFGKTDTVIDVDNCIDHTLLWATTSSYQAIRVLENSCIEIPHLDAIAMLGYLSEEGVVTYKGLIICKWILEEDGNITIKLDKWQPYQPNPNEIISYGFNMLLDKPYDFKNYIGSEANFPVHDILGIIPYDRNGNIITKITDLKNTIFKAKIVAPEVSGLNWGEEYQIFWEYRINEQDSWKIIGDWKTCIIRDNDPTSPTYNDLILTEPNALDMPVINDSIKNVTIRAQLGPATEVTEPNTHLIPPDYYDQNVTDTTQKLIDAIRADTEIPDSHEFVFIARKGFESTHYAYVLYTVQDTLQYHPFVYYDISTRNMVLVNPSEQQMSMYFVGLDEAGNLVKSLIGNPANELVIIRHNFDSYLHPVTYSSMPVWYGSPDSYVVYPANVAYGIGTFVIESGAPEIAKTTLTIKNTTKLGYFNRQLLMYGENMGDHVLQFSLFEDINYAPFPSGAVTFQEPIIHVHEHNNSLIVFCRHNIYMLYGGADPTTLKKTKIYSNLSITEADRNTVVSVGQDVFFMVGTKGYVITPNKYKIDEADVKIVCVNDAIEELLSDPREYIRTRLDLHYGIPIGNKPINVTSEIKVFTLEKKLHIFQSCFVVTQKEDEEDTEIKQQIMLVYNYDLTKHMWTIYDTLACSFPKHIKVVEQHFGFQLWCANHPNKNGLATLNYFAKDGVKETQYIKGDEPILYSPTYNKPKVLLRSYNTTIIDGDTLDTDVLGRIRLLGINCPENTTTHEPWGMAATQYTKQLVESVDYIEIEFTGLTDIYDRKLCYVWVNDKLLNAQLVLQGLANLFITDEDNRYEELFREVYYYATDRDVDPNYDYINKIFINNEYVYTFDEAPKTALTKHIQAAVFTGNLDIDLQNYKRFERVLIEVTNIDGRSLPVKFDFKIDGDHKLSSKNYRTLQDVNPESGQFGAVYTAISTEDNYIIQGTTVLDEWRLDVSPLPPLTRIRLDIKTPGKGRVASFILNITVKGLFELLNYGIIYKKRSV